MGYADQERIKTYSQFCEINPVLRTVVPKGTWMLLKANNKRTIEKLGDEWKENLRKNIKYFRRYGSLSRDCIDIGFNKAMVAVGAGNSFNKNKHVLKELVDSDGILPWEERNFYIVASNHMYKPLLKDGIIPDFVMLVDASDVTYKQLCENIPESGRNTILICGLHCSHKIVKEWIKQGREVRFYVNVSPGMAEYFKEVSGKVADPHSIIGGGNVLNTLWVMSMRYFHTYVFMALGNDLSYPLKDTKEEQRQTYYSDGDYSSNSKETGTGRDEANVNKKWMGIKSITRSNLYNPNRPNKDNYNIDLEPVGTAYTLWVYKSWMEAEIVKNMGFVKSYHYFNCSEGGILGVCNKDENYTDEGLNNFDNWFLLDEVCPRYHTAIFKDAIEQFLKAKGLLWQRTVQDAPSSLILHPNDYAINALKNSKRVSC